MKLEIACPKCDWEPDGGAYWMCECGHTWNTFETVGKCPQCSKVHKVTRCPTVPGGCGKISPHVDWYKNLDDIMREEIERILRGEPVKVEIIEGS